MVVYSVNRLSRGARRAWARAYVTALNRGAPEVTIEDAIFGLCKEFGTPALGYFKDPSQVSSLIDGIDQAARVHSYDLPKLSEEEGQVSGPSGEIMLLLPRLPLCSALEAVLASAEQLAKSGPHPVVELDHIMRALAAEPGPRALLKDRGIEFRGEPEAVKPEPPKRAMGESLSPEEAMALFRDWAAKCTRVICEFSGTGSAVTSLAVNFQITGTFGLIDTDLALVRIDGENASCLIDLRGGSVAQAGPAKLQPGIPIRPSASRVEILLAAGGRCSIAPLI